MLSIIWHQIWNFWMLFIITDFEQCSFRATQLQQNQMLVLQSITINALKLYSNSSLTCCGSATPKTCCVTTCIDRNSKVKALYVEHNNRKLSQYYYYHQSKSLDNLFEQIIEAFKNIMQSLVMEAWTCPLLKWEFPGAQQQIWLEAIITPPKIHTVAKGNWIHLLGKSPVHLPFSHSWTLFEYIILKASLTLCSVRKK